MASSFGFDAEGYFLREGARFVPFGVNYWPARCGDDMWRVWPEDEIREDIRRIARLGMNYVRVVLRWPDFEPEAGSILPEMWQRFGNLLHWCRDADVVVHPVLFGSAFDGAECWPSWAGNRNIYSDSWLIERAEAFATTAARRLSSVAHAIIALDLGDQLVHSRHTVAASPAEIAAWCRTMTQAVRSHWRDALIGVGNDHYQITSDRGWRLGAQPGVSFYGVQAEPVPTTHPLGFDGMTDVFGQSLLPAYVKVARAWGPVLVQSLGTGGLTGHRQTEAHLRAVLPALWEAGACGMVWSSLYDRPGVQGSSQPTGLIDESGQVKPELHEVVEFGRSLARRNHPEPNLKAWGIYLPQHFYLRDDPGNPGNTPGSVMGRLALAQHFLQMNGGSWLAVRGDQALPRGISKLLIPGASITGAEAGALKDWVAAGGELFWHGPDPTQWGRDYTELLGARPADYRSVRGVSVNAFGERFTFGHFPHDLRVEVDPSTATVLARDHQEVPVIIENRIGSGCVRAALPLIESAIAPIASHPTARDRWASWYRGFLEL